MGKIIDEIVLKPVKLERLQMINKDKKNPRQDQANEDRKDQDDHPGLISKDLGRIEMISPDDSFKPGADFHIPVDIQEKRRCEGDNRQNKNENGMIKPFISTDHRKNFYNKVD